MGLATNPVGPAAGESAGGGWPPRLALGGAAALLIAQLTLLLLRPGFAPLILAATVLALGLAFGGFESLRREARRGRADRRTLTESAARLHALLEASPAAIVAADLDGHVVLWSPAAERLFGWSAEEIMGRRYPAVPVEWLASWEEIRVRVLAGETVGPVQAVRRDRFGNLLEVGVAAAPIRGADGEIRGTVALVEDLSQTREGERERERLEQQLRQAQKMEAMGRLAGGVAHDFNNLLTAIRGHAELALNATTPGDEIREDLDEIARSADRAAALTRQLLGFTRQQITEPRPVDLNALIDGMDRLIQRLIGEGIRLETDLDPELGSVMIDGGQLEQVVMNLVINSRDAMPEGGRIAVRTYNSEITPPQASTFPYTVEPGDYVVLAVSDTGTGMDPETAARVFEPFFTTKPSGVGTGLGLSTAFRIVKQAHGYIWVDTRPDVGTTFLIFLPRIDEEPAPETAADPLDATNVVGGTETVLVVEDEEAVLSMAQKALERRGYRVITARRGREAIRAAAEHNGEIHALFCDLIMPDISGRDVASYLRSVRPGIRVLMTSGYSEEIVAGRGMIGDGVAFLAKPYTPAEFAARIRKVLENGH